MFTKRKGNHIGSENTPRIQRKRGHLWLRCYASPPPREDEKINGDQERYLQYPVPDLVDKS
eukprot:1161995-Pelagomonas_calceolata.AAC.3